MKSSLLLATMLLAVILAGCSSNSGGMVTHTIEKNQSFGGSPLAGAFHVRHVSTDTTYGYSEANPIKVGIVKDKGPALERLFLDQLAGPNGEAIRYSRVGSCCPFETPNGYMGIGLLDKYQVWVGANAEPVVLYINMYDYEEPKAPVGFSPKTS